MRSVLLGLGLLVAGLAMAWLDRDAGIPTWLELREEVAGAERRLETLRAGNAALREEAAALRGDPAALERAVREELGWVRPGELLIRIPRRDALP
ncbi:MAG: septum formation initiator family protein [Myxococcota bacterium]|nr:septum formation initiator family protein [Myxococcota bacterium]